MSTPVIADDLRGVRPELPVLTFPGPAPEFVDGQMVRSGVVWLGSAATERYLVPWASSLRAVANTLGFVAMGGGAVTREAGLATADWSIYAEAELLGKSLIGIFVQDVGPWDRRKSGYKILEYIAHGVVPAAQRGPAAVAILGEGYPYLFEEGGLSDAVSAAASLSAVDRQAVIAELRDRIDSFSYVATVQRWISFARELKR